MRSNSLKILNAFRGDYIYRATGPRFLRSSELVAFTSSKTYRGTKVEIINNELYTFNMNKYHIIHVSKGPRRSTRTPAQGK